MKRILGFILLASAMSALFSCAKEEIASPQETRDLVITATHEDDIPATKTELVGSKTYWSVGDKISVFFGSGTNGGAEFTSLNTQPSASADFTGVLTAVTGSEDGSSSMKYFWGVYPYSKDNSVTLSGTSNYLTTVVNDIQYGVADSYSSGQNIWVGRNYGLELSFKSLLSGIKFTFTRSDITRVTIQGNNGEYIAGKVNVTMDSGVPVVSSVVEGKQSVSLLPQSGGTFQKGAVYRVLFLPTNFTNGLTVTFYTTDGSVGTKTYGELNFERNKPKAADNADEKATWEAGAEYVEMAPGVYWATNNVGADHPWDYGDYFAWGETTPKSDYSWATYKYGTSPTNLTKYNASDGKTVLDLSDDAAYANSTSIAFRIPTYDEWSALFDTSNYTWTWVSDYEGSGHSGYTVTSKVQGCVGNMLFLPAAGLRTGTDSAQYDGVEGYYWSSSLSEARTDQAIDAGVYSWSNEPAFDTRARYIGLPVRAVYDPIKTINGHQYVDMGNGLKWATCNVGATKPEDYGDYFAWGETATKMDYMSDWSNYFDTSDGGFSFTKYNISGGKTVLDLEDDAARAKWGGSWRMPTYNEWQWLLHTDNCTRTWTADYDGTGKAGMVLTSKVAGFEGNSIFLPAAGYREDPDLYRAGSYGYYFSSSLSERLSENAWGVYFNSEGVDRYDNLRFSGLSVRPVSD